MIPKNYDKSKVRLTSTVIRGAYCRPKHNNRTMLSNIFWWSTQGKSWPEPADIIAAWEQQPTLYRSQRPNAKRFRHSHHGRWLAWAGAGVAAGNNEKDEQQPKTKVRCPPIVVYSKTVVEINAIMANLGIGPEDYTLRMGRERIQIQTKCKQRFITIVDALKSDNARFYNHETSDATPIKIVLYGLPNFGLEEVKEERKLMQSHHWMSNCCILPIEETVRCTFWPLLKGLPELKKTKSLFNVIVGWRFYTRKTTDAVQCFRCQHLVMGCGTATSMQNVWSVVSCTWHPNAEYLLAHFQQQMVTRHEIKFAVPTASRITLPTTKDARKGNITSKPFRRERNNWPIEIRHKVEVEPSLHRLSTRN